MKKLHSGVNCVWRILVKKYATAQIARGVPLRESRQHSSNHKWSKRKKPACEMCVESMCDVGLPSE